MTTRTNASTSVRSSRHRLDWQDPSRFREKTPSLDGAPSLGRRPDTNRVCAYAFHSPGRDGSLTLALATQRAPGWTTTTTVVGRRRHGGAKPPTSRGGPSLCYGLLTMASSASTAAAWVGDPRRPSRRQFLEPVGDGRTRPSPTCSSPAPTPRFRYCAAGSVTAGTADQSSQRISTTAYLALDNEGLPHVLYSRYLSDWCGFRSGPAMIRVCSVGIKSTESGTTYPDLNGTWAASPGIQYSIAQPVVYADDTAQARSCTPVRRRRQIEDGHQE